tara:strand:- start:19333 stop:21099 length:1767 start_codon:yes stop_codon:yes gene_type:complete
MSKIKKILFILTPYQRKQAVWLLVMLIIVALLDMIGVASILPFIAILSNPGLIETNSILKNMFQISAIFGVDSQKEFFFASGILVFIILIISLTFKAFATYLQVRFVKRCEYSIGKLLVEGYLNQPYSWFLSRHSTELGRTILSEASQVAGGGIKPLIEVTAKGTITIALLLLLIIADTKLALIVGFSLGGSYWTLFYCVRRYLDRTGKKRLKHDQSRFMSVGEAFNAVKEIKFGGLEKNYVNSFSDSADNFARANTSAEMIGLLPRFILEAVAFGGVLLVILYVMMNTGNFNSALPILSLYVFAGYRLMPALQQVYVSFTQLTFVGSAIDKLYENIKNIKQTKENLKEDKEILSFNETISLKNIYYNYPNASMTTLKNINLNIAAKSTIGLIGTTGSGKTTTIDIILGLLEPQKGTLEIDGKIITKQNSRSWQRAIGYVPQQIYLADNSIAANIAFGVEPKNIDLEAVENAAKTANLHKFVIDELPQKYQTPIGERGVRLSGGQRQRIGIARALYRNPKLLIFDEATNALDDQTEKAVMDAVNNLGKNTTIILIAHRLNTLKNCDAIFKLEKGHLTKQGALDTFNLN